MEKEEVMFVFDVLLILGMMVVPFVIIPTVAYLVDRKKEF